MWCRRPVERYRDLANIAAQQLFQFLATNFYFSEHSMSLRLRRAVALSILLAAQSAFAVIVLPPITPRVEVGSQPVFQGSYPFVRLVGYGWSWDTAQSSWEWSWLADSPPIEMPPSPTEAPPPVPPESCAGLLVEFNQHNCSALTDFQHIPVNEESLAEATLPNSNQVIGNADGAFRLRQMVNDGNSYNILVDAARNSHISTCNYYAESVSQGCYAAGNLPVTFCESISYSSFHVCNYSFLDGIDTFIARLPSNMSRADGVRICRETKRKMEERQCVAP
jgi:hypothetical protein